MGTDRAQHDRDQRGVLMTDMQIVFVVVCVVWAVGASLKWAEWWETAQEEHFKRLRAEARVEHMEAFVREVERSVRERCEGMN